MRMTITILLAVLAQEKAFAAVDTHTPLDAVLGEYVENGRVDYAGLQKDRARLDSYIATVGAIERDTFQGWTEDRQLALLINIYNATTLQLIIDHYPVDGIKSIGSLFSSPWKKKVVTLFGKRISLDTLEHEIIRTEYREPRIHFALVCAARSCPPLRNEAYRGPMLDRQLEEQTRAFLQDPASNRLDAADERLLLSPIFSWYGGDFGEEKGALKRFVAPYLNTTYTAIEHFDIDFTDYDWSLNDQAAK